MMRRILLAVAVMAAWGSSAAAQQSRADLLRSAQTAYDDFAPERALDLLKAAANPALGPTDTAWVRGVHLLTQIFVEGGNQDLAKTWSRWAARLAPGMPIDTVNFLASAVSALREARTFSSARTSGDAVTRTSWRWVGRGSSETRGRIVVEAAAMPVAVNARVVGGAFVPPGAGLSLAPGSYEIEVGAPGYLPARVTREVMPGVTTVVAFSLTSAAVASDVIAENVRRRFFANIAPLSVRRFGASAPACAAGAFVSRDGLVLTSYQAIRGGDGITSATTSDPRGIRVAAYDVAADMAVLHVPATRTDSIALSSTIVEGQSIWAVRFADCATPAEVRVRVSAWTDRPLGNLQLSDQPGGAAAGSPLVDVSGALAGVWAQGLSAVPATKAADLIAQARRNVAQQQLIAVADLSRRENHAYGSAIIASEALGTTVKVTPLEPWQWERVAASARTPYLFVGPMGRYRVEVSSATGARREQEITIRPGVEQRLMVALNAVAMVPEAATNIAKPKRRSRLPWVLAAVGGGGLAAAVALGGGGSKGNDGGGGPPPPSTGSITVRVPVNPP